MNGRALVVEDSPIVQKVHAFYLQQAGYEVAIADSAEAALLLMNNNVVIIFVDLNLPGISGLEFTAEIRRRENPVTQKIPIIGVSAAANEPGKIKNCLAAGMNELLAKPLSAKQMTEVLQRWL
jgi:CheY-like chemotaxis protein